MSTSSLALPWVVRVSEWAIGTTRSQHSCTSGAMAKQTYVSWFSVFSGANLLPSGTSSSEVSVCLRHLQRLGHDTFLFLIISDFGVASHWEIFPQRMTIEAVVSHNASEVRMAGEENTEEIPHFSFIPIGTVIQACDAWDWSCLVCVGLHAYS